MCNARSCNLSARELFDSVGVVDEEFSSFCTEAASFEDFLEGTALRIESTDDYVAVKCVDGFGVLVSYVSRDPLMILRITEVMEHVSEPKE